MGILKGEDLKNHQISSNQSLGEEVENKHLHRRGIAIFWNKKMVHVHGFIRN